jgi:hypothetical protein
MTNEINETKIDGPKEPEIIGVHVSFEQEGNTLGTTKEYEKLSLSLEFQAGIEEGPFYVIKTKGWSFDGSEEIQKLIDRASMILKK